MGRPKSAEQVSKIREVFQGYKDVLVNNNILVKKSDKIWKQMAEELNNGTSANALYTAAIKDYFGLHSLIGFKKNIVDDEPENAEELEGDTSFSEDEDSNDDEDQIHSHKVEFSLFVPYYEFIKHMRPHFELYKSRKGNKTFSKKYYVFQQRSWTSFLHKKLESNLKENKINCTFMFKRCKIYVNSKNSFAVFSGYCKECKSKLFGSIENAPLPDVDVEIHIVIKSSNDIIHKRGFKRPLIGQERQNLSHYLIDTNMAPSHYRTVVSSKEMNFGDSEPPSLPRLSTIRVAKHEEIKKRRIHEDVVMAICKMKVNPDMHGAIREIGIDPFFVHFWTNYQIHVYNRYCQKEYSVLNVDATGGVVKKIKNISGSKSKHIFLYECTIRSKMFKSENQFSVCNMLSETQNAVAIYNWLANWLRCGALKPNEVVTDMSLALMYACVLAFTTFKTLDQYIRHCYEVLFRNESHIEKCYIRNDVAHVMKIIAGWPSLKNVHRLTRQFYLKTMGQLIQCTDIVDAENILRSLFFVAYSDTEGNSNITGKPTLCEEAKNWLLRRVGTGSIEHFHIPEEEEEEYNKDIEDFKEPQTTVESPFYNWANEISKKCVTVVNTGEEIGIRGNQQCRPSLAKDLIQFCKTLPLWSAIMKDFFPRSSTIGSSSSVESNFNNIKNRTFKNTTLPIRADEFLNILIQSTVGFINIIEAATMKKCEIFESKKEEENAVTLLNSNNEDEKDDTTTCSKNVILCSSCQLNLPKTDQCAVCFTEIHNNIHCSVNDNNRTVCFSCHDQTFSKSNQSEREEQRSFENWRGLGEPIRKKRLRFSYLEPSSELLEADFTSLKEVVPVGHLRNGHLDDLQPIRITSQYSVTLSNTCAYDTLIQLMASAYCDSEAFKDLINYNRENITIAAMVFSLVKEGVTRRTYRHRAQLIMDYNKELLPLEECCNANGIVHLAVETQISTLLSKTLMYCAIRSEKCLTCLRTTEYFLDRIEIEINDASNIEDRLRSFLKPINIRKQCNAVCEGRVKRETKIAATHIFIEPVNVTAKNMTLCIKLDQIPKKLLIGQNSYVLRGVIGYNGPDNAVGHFVCYSFRHNNKWEEYDDLKRKSEPRSAQQVVHSQLILYSL